MLITKVKQLFRITNHNKPKYQLYQPGFNPSNSCWLSGDWITLSKNEWEKQKGKHCKLYANLQKDTAKQHHRDKPTKLKDMTPAQKQAYQYYSGDMVFDAIYENEYYGGVSLAMSGRSLKSSSELWLRKHKCKILKNIKNRWTGKITTP